MILDFNSTGMTEHIEAVRQYNSTSVRFAHVITFGCQQNEADSEKIRALAVSMGYDLTDSPEEASLIILNTCAQKHKSAGIILRIVILEDTIKATYIRVISL